MPEHDNLEFLKLPRPDTQGNQLEEPTKQHVAQPTKPPVARLSPNIRHRLCRFRLGGRARRPDSNLCTLQVCPRAPVRRLKVS
jgi:hypothetical protein